MIPLCFFLKKNWLKDIVFETQIEFMTSIKIMSNFKDHYRSSNNRINFFLNHRKKS